MLEFMQQHWHWLTLIVTGMAAAIPYVAGMRSRSLIKDGKPTVDETVTRSGLDASKLAAMLALNIYRRVEDLANIMKAVSDLPHARVFHSLDHSAVCVIVYDNDAAWIVWRGTNPKNRRQVRANAKCTLVSWERVRGSLHSGLAEQWSKPIDEDDTEIGTAVLEAIVELAEDGRKLYIVGHSQGGGLAHLTVAACERESKQRQSKRFMASGLITFGSMRAGDEHFANFVTHGVRHNPEKGRFGILRWRNNNDIVTICPSYFQGYRHASDDIYIWPNGAAGAAPGIPRKIWQHVKANVSGELFDGLSDHSMNQYAAKLENLEIPELNI